MIYSCSWPVYQIYAGMQVGNYIGILLLPASSCAARILQSKIVKLHVLITAHDREKN